LQSSKSSSLKTRILLPSGNLAVPRGNLQQESQLPQQRFQPAKTELPDTD
jgi:hypothetical protein